MKVIERLFDLQEIELGPKAGTPEAKRSSESIRKEIPEPILAHYDRLLARGKKGVALVRHGVCSGCQMKLATGPHAALIRGDDIAMCDNCARYLLMAPEDATKSEPAAPSPGATDKPGAKRARRRKST